MGGAGYTRRIIDDDLDALLPHLPAIALDGPKGVGKTATALQRAATVRRLDQAGETLLAAAEPALLLEGEPPVLLDEWQRVPRVWDLVRRAVDDGAAGGAFLLTGSAVPVELPAHSGAGRIVTRRMRPLSLAERLPDAPRPVSLASLLEGGRDDVAGETDAGLEHYVDEIVRSGYPGLRGLPERALRARLDAYLEHLLQRDFIELGHRVRSGSALRRWLAAYAAATATTASFETIRDAATSGEGDKPARTTVQPYRETLEALYVLDSVDAWAPSGNRIARLAAAPKHHLVDPALACRLLGVDGHGLLGRRPAGRAPRGPSALLGPLFESLVTQSVRVYAQASDARIGHLRSRSGAHEVDLIVERGDGCVVAIEVKLTRAAEDADVRHLRWLGERLGDDLLDAVVVTVGRYAYRRPDGIAVVPAALLGP